MSVVTSSVVDCLSRAQKALITSHQRCFLGDLSYWVAPSDTGAATCAQVVIALQFVGLLTPDAVVRAARVFQNLQLTDGSFGAWSRAKVGDAPSTAVVWAALSMLLSAKEQAPSGPDGDAARAQLSACFSRADAFMLQPGMLDTAKGSLMKAEPAVLFIALAGGPLAEQFPLPPLPVWPMLFEELDKVAEKGLSAGTCLLFAVIGALSCHLRGDFGAHPDKESFFTSLEAKRCIEYIENLQNDAGGWIGAVPPTALAMCALFALGRPNTAPSIQRTLKWFQNQENERIGYRATGTAIWTTALSLRALLSSGLHRSDPVFAQTVPWLLNGQAPAAPRIAFTADGAPKGGGWGFQVDDPIMQDCDDTGVVLCALGLLLDCSSGDLPDQALAEKVRVATNAARDWLLGMQNPSGGWPAYQHGFPDKPAGPVLTKPPGLDFSSVEAFRASLAGLDTAIGDPATEDVTGRVLFGLGQLGFTVDHPAVAKAVSYLQAQQCTMAQLGLDGGDARGPWWSRWATGYLASTSWILRGLAAVNASLTDPWIQAAIRWVKSRQRPDGGWGEDVASYSDPKLAGTSTTGSMVPLTGLALAALMDAGEGDSPEVDRGIAYLLAQEETANGAKSGKWSCDTWLSPLLPPNGFYFIETSGYYVLEALSRHVALHRYGALEVARGDVTAASLQRAATAGAAPNPLPASHDAEGAWSDAFLDAMRQTGDADADAVIRDIFADGQLAAVNAVLGCIVRSDDPVPAGLPPKAQAYFERTAALPDWASATELAASEQLFAKYGWTAVLSLFCSSLPQAYAAANGARVLVGTRGMTLQAERRIFETAQFVFDVTDQGAMSAQGRGVRTTQKVRLMHAAIRHLTLQEASWDMRWGAPINQEDLAGTLMSFSCVILDAWKSLGLSFSSDEAESYFHAWKVVGYVLGVHPALLPRDVADGEALMAAIRRRQWQSSPQGKALAAALIGVIEKVVPQHALSGLPATAIRRLTGDRCGDLLGLAASNWTSDIVSAGEKLESLFGRSEGDSRATELLNHLAMDLLKGIVVVMRQSKSVHFRLPSSLLHAWNTSD